MGRRIFVAISTNASVSDGLSEGGGGKAQSNSYDIKKFITLSILQLIVNKSVNLNEAF